MKKWFLFCAFLPYALFSQQLSNESSKWIDASLKAKNVDINELSIDFIKYNFSFLWLSKQEATIGFIGDNYQRFYIHFQKIIKSDSNPSNYIVEGKTRVGNNICSFNGVISILNIRAIDKQEREQLLELAKKDNDIDRIERHKYPKFLVLAEYDFKEDKNQKGTGIFKGTLKSYFYFKDSSIIYDDLDLKYKDSFSNNLFVGTWKSYTTRAENKCNWGNYRIPYSGDLDIGAGHFSINEKYLKNGWENYRNAYITGSPDALKEEKEMWW